MNSTALQTTVTICNEHVYEDVHTQCIAVLHTESRSTLRATLIPCSSSFCLRRHVKLVVLNAAAVVVSYRQFGWKLCGCHIRHNSLRLMHCSTCSRPVIFCWIFFRSVIVLLLLFSVFRMFIISVCKPTSVCLQICYSTKTLNVKQLSVDDTPSKCMPPPHGHSRRYLLASYSVSIS